MMNWKIRYNHLPKLKKINMAEKLKY